MIVSVQRVNTVRDFHWYDVVSVEQVLARLALDANHATIATAATQFLVRSYFPMGVRGVEQYKYVVVRRLMVTSALHCRLGNTCHADDDARIHHS